MVKGSVIVNGVTFEDNAARVVDDDGLKVSAADLSDGMMVTVQGTINADGVTGTASAIKVENEVRGPITTKAADSMVVLGQTIFVDGATVFSNVANFAALQSGQDVEVHGARDAAGNIRATRVELLAPGAGADDEVRGVVSGKTASTFNIGTLLITFSDNVILPAGATFNDGDLVEVHLGPGNVATRIKVEDLIDDEFEPAEGQEFEVEAFVTGFSGHPGTFFVGDQQVQTLSSTRFEGGVEADLANNIKVEADGHLQGGVLVAEKIAFKDTVRIETNAETASGASRPTSFSALGKNIVIASTTELGSNVTLPIATGAGVRIRGFLNTDGSITAIRIDSINAVDLDRHILQGPVSSFDAGAGTLVILGFTITTSGPGMQFQDDNDSLISPSAFFGQLVADRTIVKARGSVSGTTITANEVGIE
jgi:hypothetical protein